MSRNLSYQALTLRVRAQGESNREAWFLTAEEGIIRATIFGGPKSKLRAQVMPFHEGKLLVYHDPVKDTRKVSEFDIHSYRAGLRELYERIMAANAVAETILAFHGGGGNWEEASSLAASVLDALETADREASSRLALYFLWHWAGILGLRHKLSLGTNAPEPASGAGSWLKMIETLPAGEVKRVSLDTLSMEQAQFFTQSILSNALGKRLGGWDMI